MSKNKCCGNCKQGWTEITPDNVDDIYNLAESRFVDVLDSRTMVVKGFNDWCCTLSTMSKMGGYYYYVLPEFFENSPQEVELKLVDYGISY